MNKKRLIEKLLSKLSEEELEELLGEDDSEDEAPEEPTHRHTINSNRRGSGYNKRAKRESVGKKNKKRRGGRKNSKGKACRQLPMEIGVERKNRFDEMISNVSLSSEERKELTEAAKSDKKTKKIPKFKSSRGSSLIDVECCVCGDEYEVSAGIVHNEDRWKCNNCSCQPGF